VEYPAREGELLSVIAIDQHILTLIGGDGHHYRAKHCIDHNDPNVQPLRPADILVVIHPNPSGKSVLVEHATKRFQDSSQYHLIFETT
jgi:hypothetical protein